MSTTQPASDDLLSTAQAARLIGVSQPTLTRWLEIDDRLQPARVLPTGRKQWRRSDVVRYIDQLQLDCWSGA